MKLNLIVIGNKPLKTNISDLVDSFDYVIRVSRMHNFGITGEKIDGIFLEANEPFKFLYKGGEFKEHFIRAKQIFMCPFWHERFAEWKEYITENQYKNVELIDDEKIAKIIGFVRPTSSIRIIAHLLNSDWCKKYAIHFAGIDVEERINFVDKHIKWAYHRGAGAVERDYLLKQMNLGNLFRVENEPVIRFQHL